MGLVEKIEHKEPNKQIVLEESIDIEKLIVLNASLEIEKNNFQELNYVVNFESYFEKQICDLMSYMPLFSSLM